MSEPLTAVLVLHYGKASYTGRCLESILRWEGAPESYSLLVIDNSETQDYSLPAEAVSAGVTLVRTGKNLGYGGGMNFGIQEARRGGADLLFLLNNDVVFGQSCLTKLGGFLQENPKAGLVAPLIVYDGDPERIWATGSRILNLRGRSHDPFHNRRVREFPSPVRVDALTGCALMVRREVFDRIGLFDENYFAYYEDVDLCRRAGLSGYDSYFFPQVTLRHAVSASSRGRPPLRRRPEYFMARNRIYFVRKGSGRTKWLLFLLFLSLEALWYLLKNSLRLKFSRIAAFALGVHDALADDSWLVGEPVRRGISACIITKDAGKTIERCLRSLEGAVDEIVVVDSGSGDDTLEICHRYTDKVYRTRFEGNFADLRNQAAAHASGPWILALDADEYLGEELRAELSGLCSQERYWGFFLKRINFYRDRVIRFGFPGIDSLVRLYRKEGSFFAGKVHEKVVTQGLAKRVVRLPLYHRQPTNNYTRASLQSKWRNYIEIEARERGEIPPLRRFLYRCAAPGAFLLRLLRDLFLLGGILDGYRGIKIALLLACYRYRLFMRLGAKTNE